jgi:hypothetical protein
MGSAIRSQTLSGTRLIEFDFGTGSAPTNSQRATFVAWSGLIGHVYARQRARELAPQDRLEKLQDLF